MYILINIFLFAETNKRVNITHRPRVIISVGFAHQILVQCVKLMLKWYLSLNVDYLHIIKINIQMLANFQELNMSDLHNFNVLI